jgi:inward rectifier potassium channel
MGWRRGDEEKDLGLGSVVAQRSQDRFLNKDGSFNVVRRGLPFLESLSPYHVLLTMSWTRFHAMLVGSYLVANAAFALAYLACGRSALEGARSLGTGFARAFFFSVEAFSTIGFGNITPTGFAANVVMTAEALFGLLWVAMAMGLLFARFSRPTAKILFSRNAVVAPYRGITALMFRVANGRTNQLIGLQARVMLGRFVTEDGRKVRRFDNLTLERAEVMFFPLSWTVVHPIDETSPLWGLNAEGFRASDAELLILLSGIDETFSQTVHTRTSYKPDEIVWNARFAGIFDSPKEGEHLAIDLRRLSEIEPVS